MDEERLVKRKQKAKRDGNVRQLAEICKELGDIYFETGRFENALLEYTEQLKACETAGDELKCAIAHRMIGEVHASLGNYEEALTHQTLHLEGAREAQNILEQQRALATIGRTHFCLGEALAEESPKRTEAFAAAKKAYSKSLRLCNQLENNTDITITEMMTMRARLLLNLGLVLEEQKEPQQAVELIEKAAELCKKHKLQEDLHRTNIALGALHERQGHFGLALRHVEMAIEIGDSSMKAVARLTKAELLLRLGHWLDARQILVHLYLSKDLSQNTSQQVQRLLRIVVTICRAEESLDVETDKESRRKLYEKLGDASSAVRSYIKAIEYYREMLACAEAEDSIEQIGAALVSLVQTFRDAGNFEEALPFARRELRLCTEPSEICRSALNLADLLYLTHGDKSSIMEIYDLAIMNARKSGNRSLEASVLKDLVVYFEDTGDFNEAEETKKKLDLLSDAIVDSASEAESEISHIGAELCLEDLSDVEAEMQKNNETSTRHTRRPKRGLVVKRNDKGETKLHVACINGNIEEVEKLLAAGHPTDVKDHCGWTPLHEAANHGFVEIAELLIKSGANVNDPGGAMCGGVTPLHDAASCGNFSIMCLLIKRGADLLVRTKEGDTVLDCLEGWRNRVEVLSDTDQAEYDNIHATLSAVLPKSTKYEKKTPNSETRRESWRGLVDEEDRKSDDGIEGISAGEDYRRTIASLMNRGRLIGSTVEQHSATPKKNIAPLIDSEQTLVDDWLEDDLDCTVREKTLVEDSLPASVKRKSSNSTPDVDKSVKRPRMKSNESLEIVESTVEDDSCDSNSSDFMNMFDNRPPTTTEKIKKKKRPRQISLLNSGFTRDSISRTPSPVFAYSAEATNNFERITEATSEQIKLHIRIGDKIISLKLRFPEQRETTVASVMNDIVEKFEEETGCRVQITLTTMSGEVLLRESTMKSVKPLDGIVRLVAEIVEQEIPPINERYTKICKNHQTQPRDTILKCLKNSENTEIFRLKSTDALDNEMLPLFKSLEYQSKLQVLRISNASLYDLGENLNITLKRLTALQELHLQGCDIDHNCLAKIDRLPWQLRVLDLSYNPLGPRSQETLYKLLSHLRYLQTLNLRFCKLSRFRSCENWGSLVNLDLSWNPIVADGSSCSCLHRQMLSLNISNTCNPERSSSLVREIIDDSILSIVTLETLELACCDITDDDVTNILTRATNLSRIVLNGNSKLTKIAVAKLLSRSPTLSHIDVSGCSTITEFPENDIYIENPRVCTMIISMSSDVEQCWLELWRGTANVHRLPHDVTTFKPILY